MFPIPFLNCLAIGLRDNIKISYSPSSVRNHISWLPSGVQTMFVPFLSVYSTSPKLSWLTPYSIRTRISRITCLCCLPVTSAISSEVIEFFVVICSINFLQKKSPSSEVAVFSDGAYNQVNDFLKSIASLRQLTGAKVAV